METEILHTILKEKHEALNAKMVPFAGYLMPVSYTGIIEEHKAVRERVGVFDVSHMGEFIVRGINALSLLQQITSNDVSKLAIGQVQYSCMPNKNGGIIDDLLVYRLPEDNCSEGENAYMLVVNASNLQKDWNWIHENNQYEDIEIIDISSTTGLIALQGPMALKTLQAITNLDLKGIDYYHFKKGKVLEFDNILVSATGYTGAGGFEIYAKNEQLPAIWDALLENGKIFGISPCGLGCRDTLRLEMGFCLYGNDIDDTTSPLEAGLGWITKLKKGSFNSLEILTKQKLDGIKRKLVGLSFSDRRVPRHGYPIYSLEGAMLGHITSGTLSPTLDHPIGMGYVPMEIALVGNTVLVEFGSKRLEATIVNPPFIKNEN